MGEAAPRDASATTPHSGARFVLVLAVLAGGGHLFSVWSRAPSFLGVDFAVYRLAAQAALDGGPVYAVAPAVAPEFTFLYPPIAVLPFLPFALLSQPVGFAVFTGLNLAAGLALGVLVWRYVEAHGVDLTRVDRLLLAAVCLVSSYRIGSVFYGQVNVYLALSLAVGFVALERDREWLSGTAFAIPAFVKVFPAVVGVWLLRRRAWRGVAAAVVTGIGLHLLGLLVFGPDLVATYLDVVLHERTGIEAFRGGLPIDATYMTLRRATSHLFPTAGSGVHAAAAFALLAPPVAFCYRDVSTHSRRLTAAFATVVGLLLFFPSYQVYVVYALFPLLPLLYLFPTTDPFRRPRQLFLAGAALSTAAASAGTLLAWLATVPAVGGGLATVLRPLFTLASPTTCGLVLAVLACVWLHSLAESGQ
ncbi:glycosyltransferase family 87 protein [Haloarchaeobius sp. TZWSO28]|uniref:glycosyltransferase family 87 protein n=1 Tax=Haloarchaeobius sp. TZWSO28 TaxID=3446119 RepID=UPI003EBEA363